MKTGHKTGLWAETLAALALMLKGYLIIARRHKTPLGEIDLVARRGRTLAFIEVKWRGDRDTAAEAIHAKNRDRVRNAAALYLQKHPQYAGMDARFDAMALSPKAWPRHIPNAWE
jgi:putative endonuclease